MKKNGEKYDYRRHEFDQTENVQLHSNAKPAGFFRDLISVWDYNGKKVPVPARWHPNSVIKRIVQHKQIRAVYGHCNDRSEWIWKNDFDQKTRTPDTHDGRGVCSEMVQWA